MKNIRGLLALLLVLIMVAQTGILGVSAAVSLDSNGQPIKYSTTSNSGKRDTDATTLNGTNVANYYKVYTFSNQEYDFTYKNLSTQSGNTLLNSLRTLLTKTHHTKTDYDDDCRNRLDETDCQNENGKVMLLYSNKEISWSSSFTNYNREHVWPKSLGGYETSGPGADLHHIRPTDNRINSIRNNNKFGQSSLEAGQHGSPVTGGNGASGTVGGYLGRGFFEPLDIVKGDVARICLYMYARYGGDSNYTCDKITNVFESVDVLLAWCELDPVDTWELGRNEVVGAIQGNRNVFIDYPELAWNLFNREAPENMTTPSKGSSGTTTPTTKPSTPTEAPTEAPTTAPTTPSVDPSVTGSATISFDNKAYRTSFSSEQQVWQQNGITVINDKASSTNAVADYINPVRFYAHSNLKVEAPGMLKIEFNCASGYASPLNTSIANSSAYSVSVNGNIVTVTFKEPTDSFVVNDLTAQVRVNSLTVQCEVVTPDTPGTDTPGTDTPGTDTPGTDTPGTDTPGTDTPGTDTPGTDTPGTDTPGTDTPGTDTPGTDTPGTNETKKEPTGFMAWLIGIINAILAIFGLRMEV